MHYYLDVLKKYCIFSGRARRSEFWFFILFNFIIAVLLQGAVWVYSDNMGLMMLFTIVSYMYSLAVLLPSLGVTVRRLHDVGKGGGWIFLVLVPIVGWIWLLILYVTDSESGNNRFGSNPKSQPEF
jgi:uncharacterized membrane protein YhaH (DUF805 family)